MANQRKTKVVKRGFKGFLPGKRITARVTGAPIDLTPSKVNSIEMQGERLVVRISRESHPEIFDIDRLIKVLAKSREQYEAKRKMADLCEFLSETEKSLQIILANHLEDALRRYLS
ncbi:MAG: hypothetical protein L6Q95_18880 [Planctomycetes bacterium]|nr:hypothetical protein [Planctomycetota bacterium]